MKVTTKSLLLSIFVFPGLGHLALGYKVRATIIMALAAVSAILFFAEIVQLTQFVIQQINQEVSVSSYMQFRELVFRHIEMRTLATSSLILFALSWIISIIDNVILVTKYRAKFTDR